MHGMLEILPVARVELGRQVQPHATVFGLGEDGVEHDDVIVEVGVEAGSEPMQEGYRADLDVTDRPWSSGTRGLQCGGDRAKGRSPGRRSQCPGRREELRDE